MLYNIITKAQKKQKNTKTMIQQLHQSQTKLPQNLLIQINEHQSKYNSISQIALYSSLDHIQQLSIFTKSTLDVQCNLAFCFFGNKYDADYKKDITCYIIRMFNQQIPKLKNRYSIAYVHQDVGGFLYFRSILRLLPQKFICKLKEFWIVGAGVGMKIVQLFSFGEFNSFLKSKTSHVDRLSSIQNANKINFSGRVQSQSPHPPSINMTTKLLEDSSNKLIRNKLYGKQLIDYPLSEHGIPVLFQFLLGHLYSIPSQLQAQGIMRKSCDVEQLQILQKKVMEDLETGKWKKFVQQHDDVYVICGCVKKILNNLNTPLFSYQIYEMIMPYRSDGHVQNDVQFLRNCLTKMPPLNRLVLCYTVCFLKYGIITYQQKNKMSAYNLAVVFGPCFFRPKNYRLEDLMSSGKFSFIVKLMLQNLVDVFGQQLSKSCYNLLELYRKHDN